MATVSAEDERAVAAAPAAGGRGTASGAAAEHGRRLAHRFAAFAPFAVAIALFLITAAAIPGYLSLGSLRSLFLLASLLGIASAGQTLVIVMGGLDLSVPAVIGFADVSFTVAFGHGVNSALTIPLIVLVGAAIGAANGVLSRILRANTLILTLAVGSIVLGIIWANTHGTTGGAVPQWLTGMVSVVGTVGPVPIPGAVVLWAVLAAVLIFLERRTSLGRWSFALGANARAAELAYVPALGVWTAVFAISGASAALAGILLAGFSGSADPGVGAAYLFTTLSAVVIGGTPIIGGRGGYGRTVAGCLIITEVTMLLLGIGLDEAAQQVCLGLLIIVLVALYGREPHVRMQI
jgi:ribose transport system permease protein